MGKIPVPYEVTRPTSDRPSDTDLYLWLCEADVDAGARVREWCLSGRTSEETCERYDLVMEYVEDAWQSARKGLLPAPSRDAMAWWASSLAKYPREGFGGEG